jgi:alkylation response protein AidB-like acyl-CoA dehydrogenase
MALDFTLTPEHEDLQARAHAFACEQIRPQAAYFDEHEQTPWELMKKAHDLELGPRAFLPRKYGGGGGDPVSELILQEELTWGDAGIAISIMASGLAATAILALGTEEQKERHISRLCDPTRLCIAAMGLTEPGSGSESLALKATATRIDGGYLLNGAKQFCTNGGIADIQVAFATTDPRLGPGGIAAFVIDRGTPGMCQGRKERKLGVRASHTAQVIFTDCFVAEDSRLGHQPDGASRGPGAVGMLTMLEATRPVIAAGAIGIARAAFELARDYTLEHRTSSDSVSVRDAVTFKLADMATELDAARLLAWRAAWMVQSAVPMHRGEGSMAKLYAGDLAMRATLEAVQILGLAGCGQTYPAERFMRDAKLYQIWEGTAEIQRMIIGRRALRPPSSVRVPPR